jgi:hypothetical protein
MSYLINEYFGDINNITIDETRTERPNFPIDIYTTYIIKKDSLNNDVTIGNLILLDISRTDSFCEDGVTQTKTYTFSFYQVDDNNKEKIISHNDPDEPDYFWNDNSDDYEEDHEITIRLDNCSGNIDDIDKIIQEEITPPILKGGVRKTKKTKQHRRKTMKRKTKRGGKQNKTKGIARRRRRRQIEK